MPWAAIIPKALETIDPAEDGAKIGRPATCRCPVPFPTADRCTGVTAGTGGADREDTSGFCASSNAASGVTAMRQRRLLMNHHSLPFSPLLSDTFVGDFLIATAADSPSAVPGLKMTTSPSQTFSRLACGKTIRAPPRWR